MFGIHRAEGVPEDPFLTHQPLLWQTVLCSPLIRETGVCCSFWHSSSHFWTREPVQGGLSIGLWGALMIAFSIISSRTTYWLVNAYGLCMQQWSLELANGSVKSPLLGVPPVPGPFLETFGCTSTCHMPQHARWSSHPRNKRWGYIADVRMGYTTYVCGEYADTFMSALFNNIFLQNVSHHWRMPGCVSKLKRIMLGFVNCVPLIILQYLNLQKCF